MDNNFTNQEKPEPAQSSEILQKPKAYRQKAWFWILMVFACFLIFRILVIFYVMSFEPYIIKKEYNSCLKVCESDQSLEKVNLTIKKISPGLPMDRQKCIKTCDRTYESNNKYTIQKSLYEEINKGNQLKVYLWVIFGI